MQLLDLTLRKTHRNLWTAVMIFGAWGVVNGLVIIFDKSIVLTSDAAHIIGTAYLIFGSMKLFGGLFNKVELARAGMIACMCLSTIFSGIAAVKFLNGDMRSPLIAIDTFVLGLVQLTAIAEPAYQPLTMKKEQ